MFVKKKQDRSSYNKDNKKIFSYYQNRDQQTSGNNRSNTSKNKATKIFTNIPVILSVLVIVFSIIYSITLSSTPSIKIVNNSNSIVSKEGSDRFNHIAKEELEKSIFNNSKITINTDKIQNELIKLIPEATDIAIALPIVSRSPVIYIRIAEPSLTLSTNEQKYILDEKGRVITKETQNYEKLVEVKDKSGIAINLGDQAIPTKQVDFINQVKNQFGNKKLKIEFFELSKNANELVVKLKNKNYIVKFNLLGDVRTQSGTAIATIKYLKQKNIKPSQYIDVRVEERSYYR